MTAKEYLSQARFLDDRINSKIQQISSLNELATKCTATISDMPHSPNSGGSTMADAVCKIVDLQEEINKDIDRLVDLKREIMGVIKKKVWCCSQPRTVCQMRRLPESELLEAAERLLGENFQAKVAADIERIIVSDNTVNFEFKNGTVKIWQRK